MVGLDEYETEVVHFPFPMVAGSRILLNGKGVATVHETHLCPDIKTFLQYILDHYDGTEK